VAAKTELGGAGGSGHMTRQERDRRYREAHRDELKAYRVAHRDELQAYQKAYRDAHRDGREAERLVRIKANEHERRLLQMKAENDEDVRLALWDAHIQDKLRTMPTEVSVARHPDCELDTGKFIDATLFS